jgi:membrane fusion protein (multidrug efflux system)
MLMSVKLVLEPRNSLVVPEIAVLQVGLESFVFRVKPDETVERAKVQLGARRQGEVEIEGGLAAGDRIVIEGTVKIRDGARVTEAAG